MAACGSHLGRLQRWIEDKHYINGLVANDSLHAPTSGSGAAQSATGTPFTIGNRTRDKARNFNGSIDGVRVYNRVLTPAEIQSLVNGGS